MFAALHASRAGTASRMASAAMRDRVLSVLAAWESWSVYPPLYLVGLEATFLLPEVSVTASGSGAAAPAPGEGLDAEELRDRCRSNGLPDTGEAGALLARLGALSDFARHRAEGVELAAIPARMAAERAAGQDLAGRVAAESTAAAAEAAGAGAGAETECVEKGGEGEGTRMEEEEEEEESVSDPREGEDLDGFPLPDDLLAALADYEARAPDPSAEATATA